MRELQPTRVSRLSIKFPNSSDKSGKSFVITYFAFPYHERMPIHSLKSIHVALISLYSCRQLGKPVLHIGDGRKNLGACSVLVPEAAMDEDNGAGPREYYIRPTWQVPAV